MDLKSKFFTIFKSLNPYNYKELSESKLSAALKYYLFIVVFAVFAMLLLFSPQIYNFDKFVHTSTANFESIRLSSDFKLNNSFNVISDPIIRFESSNVNLIDNSTYIKNISDEFILITPDYISYRHYLIFGAQQNIPLVRSVDIANSSSARAVLVFGFMFLLPSIIFWTILLLIVYFSVLVMLTFILLSILTTIFKIYSNPSKLLNVCLYSSTIFILLQLLLLPFFRLFLLPLAAYWLVAISAIFLWKDVIVAESNHENNRDSDYDSKSSKSFSKSSKSGGFGSKTHAIFGDSASSGSKGIFGGSKKSDSKDSYDVDEHGNLKGSSNSFKHRKNIEDDDDGYVEL
jgi:hypothetical protein